MLLPFHLTSSYSSSSMFITEQLLAWYDKERRVLPWRTEPGEKPDPYRVWLSEIMLQQTTVATMTPYFHAFIARWPTLADLARATLDDVLTAWAGLGYYARARNLYACAQRIIATENGKFPADIRILQQLPGIGPYTAAAISAIAFGQRAIAIESNIERIVARLFAITAPPPISRKRIRDLVDMLTPELRCSDFIQAAMDFGATLCTPRRPTCIFCPLQTNCAGSQRGITEFLPAKGKIVHKSKRHGVAFCAVCQEGAILLQRRPLKGLLGGMMEVPSTPWRDKPWHLKDAVPIAAPFSSWSWRILPGVVYHEFTHFKLTLKVAYGQGSGHPMKGTWVAPEHLETQALPSVMRKVLIHFVKSIS